MGSQDIIITPDGQSPAWKIPPGSPPLEDMRAFMTACETGSGEDVIAYLRRWPAFPEIKWDNIETTSLMLAARHGHDTVVKLLIDAGCPLHTQDADGNTALFCALVEGRLSTVKLLLDEGADLSLRPNLGQTALARAVYSGNEALVRFLFEKGEKADTRDKDGYTPLFQLRWCVDEENNLAPLLVQHGADVNAQTANGLSPLGEVVTDGRVKTVRQLLDLGADLNVTALHMPLLQAAKTVRNGEEIYKMLEEEPLRRERAAQAVIDAAREEIRARDAEIDAAVHNGVRVKPMRLRLKL